MAHELPVRFVVSDDMSVAMFAGLWYKADDPYAVRAAFYPVDRSGRVEWFFSREMLAQALSEHTGQGDVRMWPAGGSGRDTLYIALRSPRGSALLELPAEGVESFLRETMSLVPMGAESSRVDLDGELAQLLAGS
ncbi:SsgA family sporulation/cell division regulator [Streptomyces chiangmaiensis]|uniref:SsgA family sporulation/cell division regulator n=1 Tax=Streptomyces chiangmaiensis TaxID=766497 RepID=A0ABU7FG92_9ACTN|nr:SsgA family sporulation/cell division regulator [Streptomyces chiangmaiensis]MED7823100.1 SsgA family sporulation/cell division regulator [Streptomyces chiangmaiensis]